jgi:hypothetical protein
VIRRALRKAGRFLSSALVATLLLVFVGVWSILASFVPQEAVSGGEVASWAAAHPVIEPVVRVLGLHHAFSAPLFLFVAFLLAASTTQCAWQRTKIAMTKHRVLVRAVDTDAQSLAENHDLEVACDSSRTESEILSTAAQALAGIGIKTKLNGRVLTAVSPPWSVWGSPVFHWAILALIVVMLVGSMQRSEGQMGLAVGETKIDEPSSYGILSAGPLHSWGTPQRSIRLDAFELQYETGGVDRGPTPTVSVLDAHGAAIKSQRVYPNNTLKTGSLTVYPSDFGLSATVAVVNPSGVETGRSSRLVDFSEDTSQGTRPVGYLTVNDDAGNPRLKLRISVPLDRAGNIGLKRLPAEPKARVVVTSMEDEPVLDRVLRPGEGMELPVAGTLSLVSVDYYARLQLVDDASIPLLYAALVIALLGLGVATVGRQQIVVGTVVDAPDGATLAVRVRLWRNVTTSRSELESELAKALGRPEKENSS